MRKLLPISVGVMLAAFSCSVLFPRPPGYRECYGYRVVESGVQVRCEETGEGKWTNHIDGKFIVTNTAEEPILAFLGARLIHPDGYVTSFFKCQPSDGVELAPNESTEFSCPDRVEDFCAKGVSSNPGCSWVTPVPPGQEAPVPEPAGQVRVTLEWDERIVDLDLIVIDPSGEEISKSHPASASGGSLDWDWCCDPMNALCGLPMSESDLPAETIEWQPGTAPAGEYQVVVFYHDNCGEISGGVEFNVGIEVDDDLPVEHRARISHNQRIEVATFSR
jgi:hypothetical protein